MGIYDREYYREENGLGVHHSGQRSMVTTLIIINLVIFFIDNFIIDLFIAPQEDGAPHSHWLGNVMALRSDVLLQPWNWWKLLTYGFAHGSLENSFIFHVGFNMYGLWLFGRDVESVYGRAEFLRIYLSMVVLAGLGWLLIQRLTNTDPMAMGSVVGASGAVVGMMILFVMNYPRRTFYVLFLPGIPIPAWVLGIVFVGFDLLGALGGSGSKVAYEAHLVGAAVGYGYFRWKWNFGRFSPGKIFSGGWTKRRPKLRVHRPDESYRDLEKKADYVLDKLHREGEASLTAKEKKILEDYSRRMKQKHQ